MNAWELRDLSDKVFDLSFKKMEDIENMENAMKTYELVVKLAYELNEHENTEGVAIEVELLDNNLVYRGYDYKKSIEEGFIDFDGELDFDGATTIWFASEIATTAKELSDEYGIKSYID